MVATLTSIYRGEESLPVQEFAPGIVAALQELFGDRITEVLPSMRNIFVEGLEASGPFQEKIGQFVAARQLSDHPIESRSQCDAARKLQPTCSYFHSSCISL